MITYPKVVQRVLGFLFWALLAIVVLAFVVSGLAFIGGGVNARLIVPVSFVPHEGAVSLFSSANGQGSIIYAQGFATFEHVGGVVGVAIALALFVCLVVPALVVLRLLRALVKTVAEGRPFQARSATLIRVIGLLVIGSEILRGLAMYLLESRVASDVVATGVTLGSNLDFNIPVILLGLVIIALAEVFRHGIGLQTDVELTV